VNEALLARNETPRFSHLELALIHDRLDPDLYPNVNWQKEVVNRNSFAHSHYLSARGGNDVARYFLSFGAGQQSAA
jgi:hypothetical protein